MKQKKKLIKKIACAGQYRSIEKGYENIIFSN